MISYFDAHCDTIWRCMETGPVADYGETEQEQRAFFKTGGGLRQNCGHVDLLRDRGFARRGQFFALYDDVKRLPEGTAWQRCCEMHDWFLRELAENGRKAADTDARGYGHHRRQHGRQIRGYEDGGTERAAAAGGLPGVCKKSPYAAVPQREDAL